MNIMMFAHSGSSNRGCEAIVRSSTNMIKKAIENSVVEVVSLRPENDSALVNVDKIIDGRALKIKRASYQYIVAAFNYRLRKNESYALRQIYKNTIDNIKRIDVAISIGGDAYCYGEQNWMYEIDKVVKSEGKKLVLWGCSIGEEDISETKLKDLQNFDLILPRESLTYELLLKNGLKNVKLCADPAFTLDKEELPLPTGCKEDKVVGLNFSPLVANRNRGSVQAISEFIKYILEATDFTIMLTPHVIEEGNNDFEVLNKYYCEFKHTGRVIILPDSLTAAQYKGYISRMRFFIGARTHATIAAYSSFVPTMVLGYSVKSKGIAKDLFGKEKLVLNAEDISDINKLTLFFNEMINEEKEIRQQLHNVIPAITKKSYEACVYLKELMK